MGDIEQINPIEGSDEDKLLDFSHGLEEEEILEKLKGWNSSWENYSNTLFPKLTKYYKSYRDMEYENQGTPVKIPQVFTTIDTMLPHLVNNIFATSYVVDAKPKFIAPDMQKTYKVKNYINALLKDVNQGRKKAELIFKNLLIYGYSIVKATWNDDPDIDINPISKEVEKINSAHPDFYLVDNFSFAWEPNYQEQNLNGLEWCRERIFISRNKMKKMRDSKQCGPFDDSDMTKGEDKGKESRDSDSKNKNKGTFYDEFWCTLYEKIPVTVKQPVMHPETGAPMMDAMGQMVLQDVETGEYNTIANEYRVWLLANNKIIKFERNPYQYKPFTCVRCISSPFEFIGMGIPELIFSIANQLSLTNYQAGKMVKKIGQSVTWVDGSAGLSPYNLERIEQGVVFLKNINGVKSEQSFDPNNVKVLMEYAQYLQTEVETITGVTKFLQGTDIGDMTATQASLISQNSTNRLASILTHLQEDFIVPLAEMFFLMNKQLLEIPVDFIDNNDNLVTMQPDDFLGNYTWLCVSPTTISNKALQLQQNTQALAQFIQGSHASMAGPPQFQYVVNQIPFIMNHIAPNMNIPDISNVIIPISSLPPPPMPTPMPVPGNAVTQNAPPPAPNVGAQTPIQGPGAVPQAPLANPQASPVPMAPAPNIK